MRVRSFFVNKRKRTKKKPAKKTFAVGIFEPSGYNLHRQTSPYHTNKQNCIHLKHYVDIRKKTKIIEIWGSSDLI